MKIFHEKIPQTTTLDARLDICSRPYFTTEGSPLGLALSSSLLNRQACFAASGARAEGQLGNNVQHL
jgi:hypothetical protein